MEHVNQLIQKYLDKKKWNQSNLADKIGVSRQAISGYKENGVPWDKLYLMKTFLGIPRRKVIWAAMRDARIKLELILSGKQK